MKFKQNIVEKIKRVWYSMFPVVKRKRKHIMSKTVKAVKVVNYTPEMTKEIVATYSQNPTKETVESLAVQFGKTTRSIVAKLSREHVYQKAEYVTKTGNKPETKEAKVEKIAKMIGVSAERLGGLEASTKVALDLIFAAILKQSLTEADAEDNAETEGNAETA
jgi:hypothetical protein